MTGRLNPAFWRGRRVFLTGHTGFKGSWLSLILSTLGARVHGYALPPATDPALWDMIGEIEGMVSTLSDIGDAGAVEAAMAAAQPHVVLHLAAQPLVRLSYSEPLATFATNVMGTLHVLEAARRMPDLRAIVVVTTDKVYRNDDRGMPFGEAHPLGGHDPYSASKAACEIAVESWRGSFLAPRGTALASARGGNVIGGGDFSTDRIVPDVYRSFRHQEPVVLRYPASTRPWQHVLDCLNGYLLYAERLSSGDDVPMALNFGPTGAPVTVAELVEALQAALGTQAGWHGVPGEPVQKEAAALALDTRRARSALGWQDRFSTSEAIAETAQWYGALARGEDMAVVTRAQINRFFAD